MSDPELCSWVCKKFNQKNRKIDLTTLTVGDIFKQRRKILKKYIRKSFEEVSEEFEEVSVAESEPKAKKNKKKNRVTFADDVVEKKKKKVGFWVRF